MHHTRWRRATMAAVASLCASAAVAPSAFGAVGDLPDLSAQAPTGITMGYFDDHSRGGDNHMGWGYSGSDPEPLAISFQASLRNTGPGVLQLCSTGNDTNWRTLRQTAPANLGNCNATGPGTSQVNASSLHSRYVIANHSNDGTFNRWHVMDLQRFALVPMPTNQGGPATGSRRTIWDTQWGTCLQLDGDMACPQAPNAGTLNMGISSNTTKLTQEGAPDRAVIAFRGLEQIPTGRYQVVAMANPYGIYAESGGGTGSVACTTVQITSDPNTGTFALTQIAGTPAQCFLPRTMQSRVTGAGGTDPLVGQALDSGCGLEATGHCWLTIPEFNDPADLLQPHPVATSNVNNARATTVTDAVAVAPGATISTVPAPPAVVNPPSVVPPTTNPPAVLPITPKAIPTMTTTRGRSLTRTVLRRTFGSLPSTASVSCRITGGSTAACNVGWRRSGGVKYSGTVRVWYSSTATQVRWNYAMSVKRTKHGRQATTTTRSNRDGGRIS